MQKFEFEEQDRKLLDDAVSALTEKAVEAGVGFRVTRSKADDGWHRATVFIEDAAA